MKCSIYPAVFWKGDKAMASLPRLIPMREDPPVSSDSISKALEAQQAERKEATATTGLQFDGDRCYLPAKVLPFKDADELFTAPSATAKVHLLQLQEDQRSHLIASHLAPLVYGRDISNLTRQQQAHLRFASVYALRAQQECWTDAAHHEAVERLEAWMQTEGGKVFRNLPEAHRQALAVPMASAVISAFLGMLEGSKHITPGRYLEIIEGGK